MLAYILKGLKPFGLMETGRKITYHGTRSEKYMHHKTKVSVSDSICGEEKETKNWQRYGDSGGCSGLSLSSLSLW